VARFCILYTTVIADMVCFVLHPAFT
jgi:hypothetical protein